MTDSENPKRITKAEAKELKEQDKQKKTEEALTTPSFELVEFLDVKKEIELAKRPTLLMETFANQYLIDYNYSEAAKRCGISPWQAEAIGLKLLESPLVQNLISNLQLQVTQNLQISKERILQEYFDLATTNIQDFYDEDNNLIPLKDLPRNKTAAIMAIRKRKRTGKNGAVEEDIEMKTYNKFSALEKLAQHVGLDKGAGDTYNINFNQLVQVLPPEMIEALKERIAERKKMKKIN